MAMPKVLQGRPVWAEALRRRREELGLTQEELAARTANELGEELLAQRTISALELGQLYPLKLTTERLSAYLKALRWTPEEFSEATGLEVPFVRPAKEQPGEAYVVLPVIGTAAAGPPWPTVEHIAVPKGVLRAGTLVFRVNGDSMDTGDDRGIKDGDYVLVDPNLTDLRDGRVYLVEIVGDGLAVKRAKKAGKGWVFISDNPAGPVLTPSEARVVGQVYRKISIQEVK
jgi:repressor LexA